MAKEMRYINVDKMLEEITSEQYTEWLAYNALLKEEFDERERKEKNKSKLIQAAKRGSW